MGYQQSQHCWYRQQKLVLLRHTILHSELRMKDISLISQLRYLKQEKITFDSPTYFLPLQHGQNWESFKILFSMQNLTQRYPLFYILSYTLCPPGLPKTFLGLQVQKELENSRKGVCVHQKLNQKSKAESLCFQNRIQLDILVPASVDTRFSIRIKRQLFCFKK